MAGVKVFLPRSKLRNNLFFDQKLILEYCSLSIEIMGGDAEFFSFLKLKAPRFKSLLTTNFFTKKID